MKKQIIIALIAFSILFLVGCGGSGPPNEVESLEAVSAPGRVIGALSGSASARLARDLGLVSVVTFYDVEEMLNHLRVGTIDCIVIEQALADEIMADASGVTLLSEPLLEYDLRFAVARENLQLLDAINRAIEALENNGTLGGLRGKYFAGRSFTYRPPADRPARSGYLSLAIHPDSPPFSYINNYGEFSGFDVEVAIAISDYLGVELRIVPQELSELIPSVWFGRTDLAVGWLPDDVGRHVNVSDSYANSAHVVIVRR